MRSRDSTFFFFQDFAEVIVTLLKESHQQDAADAEVGDRSVFHNPAGQLPICRQLHRTAAAALQVSLFPLRTFLHVYSLLEWSTAAAAGAAEVRAALQHNVSSIKSKLGQFIVILHGCFVNPECLWW